MNGYWHCQYGLIIIGLLMLCLGLSSQNDELRAAQYVPSLAVSELVKATSQ